MQPREIEAWLRLVLTPDLGNIGARRLLAAFGLPDAVFTQPVDALRQVVGAQLAQALLKEPPALAAQVEATLRWLGDASATAPRRLLTLADPAYPEGLLNTEDPPLVLFVMGRLSLPWPAAIAMVGSRNPTPQGLENAREFSRSFAQVGLTVVSGMALGVDGAAHEGALSGAAPGQLATIAVVGTGLDSSYPRRHVELCRRIAERGLVMSEYLLGTPPLAQNFPRRNRIISALSQGTVVVEAALKSGSLITARMAAEQGREVFAIPGSIHSPQARGCHALIKQGAKLVESARDVLEELPSLAQARAQVPADSPEPSEDDATDEPAEDKLLAALGFDPVSIDALVARTGIAPSELQARLLEFELDGEVARLPGGLFQRVGAA
jgi:DNA processing protein